MMITGPRISCIVPFCRRTASAEKYGDDAEIICGKHWRFVSRETKRRNARAKRRMRKINRLWGKTEFRRALRDGERREKFFRLAGRVARSCDEAWERAKREAIEGAAGIN